MHVDKGYNVVNDDFGDHCSLVLTNYENCNILMFFRFTRTTAFAAAGEGGLGEIFLNLTPKLSNPYTCN